MKNSREITTTGIVPVLSISPVQENQSFCRTFVIAARNARPELHIRGAQWHYLCRYARLGTKGDLECGSP